VQAGVKPLVVSLQAVFQFGNRAGKVLEENGQGVSGLVSDHGFFGFSGFILD
jgi:hypothetical protein